MTSSSLETPKSKKTTQFRETWFHDTRNIILIVSCCADMMLTNILFIRDVPHFPDSTGCSTLFKYFLSPLSDTFLEIWLKMLTCKTFVGLVEMVIIQYQLYGRNCNTHLTRESLISAACVLHQFPLLLLVKSRCTSATRISAVFFLQTITVKSPL